MILILPLHLSGFHPKIFYLELLVFNIPKYYRNLYLQKSFDIDWKAHTTLSFYLSICQFMFNFNLKRFLQGHSFNSIHTFHTTSVALCCIFLIILEGFLQQFCTWHPSDSETTLTINLTLILLEGGWVGICMLRIKFAFGCNL